MLNKDQNALLHWITAGLNIPDVREFHGDANYLLRNMIAKYSLGADEYLISEAAYFQLKEMRVNLEVVHSRSKFYGKKSPFIYEHAIPVSLVRDKLLTVEPTLENIAMVLAASSVVAMLLREEDAKLQTLGLQSAMPSGWEWGNDPLLRYKEAAINLTNVTLKVKGNLKR